MGPAAASLIGTAPIDCLVQWKRPPNCSCRCLENEGVRHVFGIPGEETLDLNEALDRSASIEFVPVRHEQGGAFMADAYGRPDRTRRGLPGHARARRHQPGHRHSRRLPRPRPGGRADRPDRPVRDAQGEPPVHRRGAHDEAGDQVERPRSRPGHHPGGRSQGVRGGRTREARRHAPGAAGRRDGAATRGRPGAAAAARAGGAGRGRAAPRRRAAAGGRAAGDPGGKRHRPPERLTRAAAASYSRPA